MRIAFNAQRLAGQRFGVGRYIEYLLRHWSQMLESGEELTVFVRQPVAEDLKDLGPRVKWELLHSRMPGNVWENLKLRKPASQHDVMFCPAYSAPVCYRAPLVVATHSVNETDPEAHTWLYRQTYSRLYRHCARQADAVVVPGKMTLDAVVNHYGISASKIHVVHQGADDAFHPVTDEALLKQTREKFFGENRPYILFVGKCSARRNIPMLIEAFARLRATGRFPHGLLLFGPDKGDVPLVDHCRKLGIAEHVVQTDGVIASHHDLVPVYAAADVFVHPSVNEGWSMTTVEAMACGKAVIASDRGALSEIARGHALMLDPPSVDSLYEALVKVLSDDLLRSELAKRAFERGDTLRWEAACHQTLEVVRAVGSRGRK